jgi:phage regulator Rha-like protein
MKDLVQHDVIESKIFVIRGHKVMLNPHLAELYGVETRTLIQAVKRNIERFPEDFMFKLTWDELNSLRSQFVTLKTGSKRGAHVKYLPYAFTEQGVAMLSSVLNSERAIRVNIQIMRTFTKMRQMIIGYADLKRKIDEMEKKYDYQFKVVFDAIRELMSPPTKPRKKIGFVP